MGDPKLLFVVGAGASAEVNLPVSSDLVKKIAKYIDIRFGIGERNSGDPRIINALRILTKRPNGEPGDINPFAQTGRQMAKALIEASSIDNFLYNHQGNSEIETLGKLGIVLSILDAERGSDLKDEQNVHPPQPRFSSFQKSWYPKLGNVLIEGCRPVELSKRFSEIGFIIFNYDRCVERYLHYKLQNHFNLPSEAAAEIISEATIVHPYGRVGALPWQHEPDTLEFGAEGNGDHLIPAAERIRTFTESVEDPELSNQMRRMMEVSSKIIFLGFSYFYQNLNLLNPKEKVRHKTILGTAFQMSDFNTKEAETDIIRILPVRPGAGHKIELNNQVDCSSFFDNYSRSLSLVD